MLALIAWQLAIPRDLYTGTNSARVLTAVAPVEGHTRLCIPNLQVPGGTGRVEFDVLTTIPRPRIDVEVRTAGGRFRGADPGVPVPGQFRLAIPIEETPAKPDFQRGTVCVVPERGPVTFHGVGAQNDHPAPRLGDTPLDGRVAVWFRPPRGERASYLSKLGDIVRHAWLFRPGLVGSWTYAVLLLVALPGLWLGAVRLLAIACCRSQRRLLASLAVLAFLNAATWGLITPAFDAPDEPEHFAYAQYLAETGKAPTRDPSSTRPALSEEHAIALQAVRIYSYNAGSDGRPPWSPADEHAWEQRLAALDHEPEQGNGGGLTTAATHAPLYYGLLAPAYLATQGQSPFSQLTAMRLTSALLGTLTAVFAFLLLAQLFPRHPVAWVAGGLLVAFQPMFGFISGAVNNDAGVNAATALLLLLLVIALRRGLTLPLAAGAGVLLALAPLLKGTAYTFYVVAALTLLLLLTERQHRRRMLPFAVFIIAFLATQQTWGVLSSVFDRTTFTTPSGDAPVASISIVDHPKGYFSYLWQIFLPPLSFMTDLHRETWPFFHIYVERVWGAFGWIALLFPRWVYVGALSGMVFAALLGMIALWRERVTVRRRWREALVLVAAAVGVIMGVEAAFATLAPRPVIAEQGRYAFTAISAYSALTVFACMAFGRRRFPIALAVVVTLVIGLSVASQLLVLTNTFA